MIRHRYSKNTAIVVSIALTLVLVTCIRVYGQVAGATMTGVVRDPSGAAVPKAHVSVRNVETAQAREVDTDAVGFYTAPNLLPGTYQVTVTAPGFSTEVRSGVTLTVGAQQTLDIALQVGQTSQQVEVKGEAPAVQLASSTIGGVISETAVADLPLNGRDWTQLATLQPGVISVTSIQPNSDSKDRENRGYGAQVTVSGSRPAENNYRIDGISVNDYANGGPGSVEGSTLGVDAVQEFSVLTSNYSAEYGRTSGGVINAITKSGTNSFHGDGYEFLRNSALDARNYFDPATKPEFRRNQFGAALGGPIRKDNTFFFGDYEGLRESQGISTQIFVPSQALRNGVLCSIPQAGVCSTTQVSGSPNPDPATGIDKAVLPYLGLWNLPNQGLVGNGDTGIYLFNGGHLTSENFATGRLDHRFSNTDSIFGSYQYDSATASQPDPSNQVLIGLTTNRRYVAIEETHVFNARLVNSARFGLNRSTNLVQGLSAINPLSAEPSLGDSPGADNPAINVPAVAKITPGINQIQRNSNAQNSFQGYDDVFLTSGIHSFRLGFAVERLQLNTDHITPNGTFTYGSLLDFLTNHPNSYSKSLPSAPGGPLGFRSTIFAGYLQDDVRLRSNLTANLGLRYETSTVPTEIRGRMSALESPINQSLQTAHIGNGIFQNPTRRNFEPRVGLAWDPFRNGKTSVRGGFGIFDVLPLPYFLIQMEPNAAPFVEGGSLTGSQLPPGSFPTEAFAAIAAASNSGAGDELDYIQPNPKRDYVMQWNLSIQRELVPSLTAMVAYAGTRGVHQSFRADDINSVQPLENSAPPYLWPMPVGSGTVLSPLLGRIPTLQWINNSYFDALEAELEKRLSHGFQVQGSYTWSRAIDQGAGTGASDAFLSSNAALFYFLPKYRRGAADFNVSHNLVINYLWMIPTPSSFHGPAAWIGRGWQVGGILQVRSGLPFTPLIGGDPLGLTDTVTVAYPDRLRGPGCGSLVNPGNVNNYIKLQCFALPMATPAIASQCQPFGIQDGEAPISGTCANLLGNGGRNEIYGPGLVNFDFSLIKDTKIKENLTAQFRAEFFNVFNHSNFESPIDNSTLFNEDGSPAGGAGAIDATSTFNRQIQFALKLIF